MPTASKPQLATIEEALARPEDERIELIRGTLTPKPEATAEHSRTQIKVAQGVSLAYDRRPSGKWPGGWWLYAEIESVLAKELFKPDIAGWRRERCPEGLHGRPATLRPDWICEVLSQSNEDRDRVAKMKSYFEGGVPHYWIANPVERVLEVYRRADLGYTLMLSAKNGQTIRAEPFDAVELRVDELFGADPED